MKRFFKHLHTINKHRRIVRRICFKIGVPWRGLTHDLSKYSIEEFWPSVKYYTNGKMSPTENERQVNGYSKVWMHHRGRNKHHIEYWFDVNPELHRYVPMKMPLKYLKEMFADRIAASKVYKGKNYDDGCPLEYLESHGGGRLMHIDTYNELHSWLILLKEKGEKEALLTIKKIKQY